MVQIRDMGIGDVLVLPGRVGNPDTYRVARIHGNRIWLDSDLRPGEKRHYMDNQFSAAGYQRVEPAAVEEITEEVKWY